MKLSKKLVAVLTLLAGMSGAGMAACFGPYCYDESTTYIDSNRPLTPVLPSATTTQMNTLVPGAQFQLLGCSSGCEIAGMICVSTGTGAGAWVHISSKTASAANSLLPCDQ